jgi:fucose permease
VRNADNSGNRDWRILAVVLVGSFMAVLDTTIVNVALPSIGQGTHASSSALESACCARTGRSAPGRH